MFGKVCLAKKYKGIFPKHHTADAKTGTDDENKAIILQEHKMRRLQDD